MREVVTYVAYDDTEFDNLEECEKYEGVAFDSLEEIFNSYRFLDKSGQKIYLYLNNVEQGLTVFEYAWEACKYIQIIKPVSEKAYEFIYHYFGFDMPISEELGLYKYNIRRGWIKVGE